jgi:hypothetical protein
VHVPGEAASAHDWQSPAQAVWQQTLWAQMPELHSAPVVQAMPSGFLPQLVPVQTLPVVQSALVAQVVLQRAGVTVSQRNGAHEVLAGAWQAPLPLQVAAAVNAEPAQVAGWHCVPAA